MHHALLKKTPRYAVEFFYIESNETVQVNMEQHHQANSD